MKTTIDTLNELPGLVAEVWLTREAKNPGGDTPHTSKPKPMSKPPTDLAVLDALRHDTKGLLARLTTCVRGVVEHAGWDAIPDLEEIPTWVSETSWLLATVSIWQDDEFLNDYVTNEVEQVRRDLASLAREVHVPEFPCTVYGCQGVIRVEVIESKHGPKLRARECTNGHPIDHGEVTRRAARLSDHPLTSLSEWLGVPLKTLHTWKARGWIKPVRWANHVPLFNLEAVQIVVAKSAERKWRRSA